MPGMFIFFLRFFLPGSLHRLLPSSTLSGAFVFVFLLPFAHPLSLGLHFPDPRSSSPDFDDGSSDVSADVDEYIRSIEDVAVSEVGLHDSYPRSSSTDFEDGWSDVSVHFDEYVRSLDAAAVAQASPHVSAASPGSLPSPLSSGASVCPLSGAPVVSSPVASAVSPAPGSRASASSIPVSSRSKTKPLPHNKTQPKPSKASLSASAPRGSVFIRVDSAGTTDGLLNDADEGPTIDDDANAVPIAENEASTNVNNETSDHPSTAITAAKPHASALPVSDDFLAPRILMTEKGTATASSKRRLPRPEKTEEEPGGSSIAGPFHCRELAYFGQEETINYELDMHSQFTYAVRRIPTKLCYGSGEHRDRLVVNGHPVTLAATINIVPLLTEDLDSASRLIDHYSQPAEEPKDYPSICTSVNQAREPGTNTYKLFDEIYDATRGVKRKNDKSAKFDQDLSQGDLVALELHVKRYGRQDEKARHVSYELVAVQLLRRGDVNDANEVQAL
ncbi:hypothetical protein FRC01_014239 [Tulasnella sp. 417]|nr:hypothetical protein FRC01_014239 [Tulasnella sp. 417]